MKSETITPIYLPREIKAALRTRAQVEGVSQSQVVREALAEYLTQDREKQVAEGYAGLRRIIGIGRDKEGRTDVAMNHDRYVAKAIEEEMRRKWRKR